MVQPQKYYFPIQTCPKLSRKCNFIFIFIYSVFKDLFAFSVYSVLLEVPVEAGPLQEQPVFLTSEGMEHFPFGEETGCLGRSHISLDE